MEFSFLVTTVDVEDISVRAVTLNLIKLNQINQNISCCMNEQWE
jgi:hypothetical protein